MLKKIALILVLQFSITFYSYAQNVGIGTTTPTEKLDVNGNINLNGLLKVNNSTGSPGQVLMKSSSNSLVWGDPSINGTSGNSNGYKHNFVIANNGSGSFPVPSDVTNVLVEIWGAGGSGAISTATEVYNATTVYSLNIGGGGGGGGYLRALLNVTGGQNINYYVGAGRIGNGDSSTLSINGVTLIAYGGKKGDTNMYAQHYMPDANTNLGLGGGYKFPNTINSNISYTVGANGENGLPTTTISYIGGNDESNINFGNGGSAGNTINTGGTGGFLHVGFAYLGDYSTWPTFRVIPGVLPKQPGGGSATNPVQQAGAKGMIIFWW